MSLPCQLGSAVSEVAGYGLIRRGAAVTINTAGCTVSSPHETELPEALLVTGEDVHNL